MAEGTGLLNRKDSAATPDNSGTSESDPNPCANNCALSALSGDEAADLAEALAALPDDERAAVVEHVRALADMSPGRRSAIYTLTSSSE